MDSLIAASSALHADLDNAFAEGPPLLLGDTRWSASASSALVSIEHALVARRAFAEACPHSATALIRLQFEAVVRAAWWMYAADAEAIALIEMPLSEESEHPARKWPGATDMLKALGGTAPLGLVQPLSMFYEVAWKGLNSYVHTGIHPLQRRLEGFPLRLAEDMLRNSNGVLHLGYRILAALTGSDEFMVAVTRRGLAHGSCLPIVASRSGHE